MTVYIDERAAVWLCGITREAVRVPWTVYGVVPKEDVPAVTLER